MNVVDEYIAGCPEPVQERLRQVRAVILGAAPEAAEGLAYGMPTYRSTGTKGRSLVHFAAMTRHLGFYPGSEGVAAFAGRLSAYKTSKGAIQFPWKAPIPYDLIADITRHRAAQESAR